MCKISVKQVVIMAMLAAISIVLVAIVRFPIIPAVYFMEYDMADVPILIGTFMYGPISGLILTIIVSVIQGVTVSATSGWIGILMHIVATGTFVITAGIVYRFKRNIKGAILALVLGSLAMVLIMIPFNLVFTVKFMGAPRKMVVDLLLPGIIPFNLVKAVINSVVTFIVYKKVSKVLDKYVNL